MKRGCILTVIFSEKYINITREELLKRLEANLSKKRYKHVCRVEEKAIYLAKKYQGNIEKASISSLLHDYAKEMSEAELLQYSDWPGFDSEWIKYGSAIWHGPLAAYIGRDKFGINDLEILNAVWGHTIGRQDMTLNEKILFIADYIEDSRTFKGIEEVRKLADKNLDDAVNYKLKASLRLQVERENTIYPETITIYNDWMRKRSK